MRIALSTILGENLEIGYQSLASLDTAADPIASLISRRQVLLLRANSTRVLLLSGRRHSSSLPVRPSCPSFLRSFFHSLDQPSKAVSLVCSAGNPDDELAGLCRGPLDLTKPPRHHLI